jgi:hypothetical protein
MSLFRNRQPAPPADPAPTPEAKPDPLELIATLLAQQNERLAALESKPTPAPTPTPTPTPATPGLSIPQVDIPEVTVTADQIAAAREDGDTAEETRLMLLRQDQVAARAAAQAVAPIQQTGFSALTSLAQSQAADQFEHYNRYRAEIEEQLNAVDPSMRALPQAQEYAYNLVIGRHNHELIAEAQEAVRRQDAEAAAAAPPPNPDSASYNSRLAPITAEAGPEDIWDKEQLAYMRDRGHTPDSFAQVVLGYRDFAHYRDEAILPYDARNTQN